MKKTCTLTLVTALSLGLLFGSLGCSSSVDSGTEIETPDTPVTPADPSSSQPGGLDELETPSAARAFSFGTAAGAVSGAVAVTSNAAYSDSLGYGFDGNVTMTEKNAVGSSFQFCAKVTNANYKVTVVTSASKVLSESLPKSFTYVSDTSGKTAVYSCPDVTGIERSVTPDVASSFDVAVCDGVMNLTFVGSDVTVSSISYEPIILTKREKPWLLAIGDSTTYNNSNGQVSWGPCLSKNYVALPSELGGFINCSMGGADALSIYNGGVHKGTKYGITEALLNMRPGDYVTINIGINQNGDSRAAQIPVFENYAVNAVKQRGGIPVIATITPSGTPADRYETDTKVLSDTYAGGKLYKAGATVPAGSWFNSRHNDTYSRNLRTIAAICKVPVIDLGMYGEQYLTDSKVSASDLMSTYFDDKHHYKRPFGEVLARYVTKSIVEMIQGTYVNPYSDELLEANAVTATEEENPGAGSGESQPAAGLSLPAGFTQLYKNDYTGASAEDCGWNGFVNTHAVARGNVSVTDGAVVMAGGADGQKGVFFAPFADGKGTFPSVADGKDFYIAFDINFYANGNAKTGNSGASTLVLSNAAGYGLPIKGTTSSGDKANPQGGVRELANCLLLLQQKEVNGNVWQLFDSDTATVTMKITSWYTIALSRIDSVTHLTITERDSKNVVFDDAIENPAATTGGLGELQLATKIAEGRISFLFDNVIIGEGSDNGKVPGMETVSHTVTFNANGGTFTTDDPRQTVSVVKVQGSPELAADFTKALTTASALGLSRSGYDFAGWASSASASKADYSDGQAVAVLSDMTLYAVWVKDDDTSLYDISAVNVGSRASFSKTISIDSQDAARRDGIVNDDFDVDESALQAKLDEFNAEDDVQPYIIARAKTKTDASGVVSQKWLLFYGAAAGSKSGSQLTVPSSYNADNSFDVLNYALSQLPAGRSEKYKLLIDSDVYSGEPSTAKNSFPRDTAGIYAISLPSYTILDFGGHKLIPNNADAGSIVPLSLARVNHVSLRNFTLKGAGRYGIWCQGCDNVVFDKITLDLASNCGVGLRIADRLTNDWTTNVYVNQVVATGGGNNAVETMKVDGIYVGTVTGTDCNDCALLLNTTTNAIVGTVRGTRCSPRSSKGVYAAFRCANYVGPNVHVHNVIANSCGRGFFSVSANHGITIDYLESTKSYKQAALIQDTQDLIIKSGKLDAAGRNTGGPGIEFGRDSKGGPLTVMNNVIKNVTVTGYSKSVSASKSDYTKLIGCSFTGSVNGLDGGHSKNVASEADLAVNTTATSVTISGATIADSAYRGWTGLRSVTIPASVTAIGPAAFMDCTGLEEVIIEGACSIGDNAFYGCKNLKTLTIRGNVTSLGNCAFGDTAIESVVLPASVTSFGHTLFSPVTQSVTINSSKIEAMGTHAFFNLGDASTITFTGAAKPGSDRLYHADSSKNASYGDWGAFWYGKTRSTIRQ